MDEIKSLLKENGPGNVSSTAYDTAWLAQLAHIDFEMSNQALNWICENQLPDGSWGAYEPFYYHDRVISTLAAMIALTYRGRRSSDQRQIDRGLIALDRITRGATKGLMADPNGATAGFEMIVPTLVAEAEKLGIIQKQGDQILGRLAHQRKIKMESLRGRKINRFMTAAFSSEMAGKDGIWMLDIENLQEVDGSINHSPSATAYFAERVKKGDPAAMTYLKKTVKADGSAPMASPFEICERTWVLWNISLIKNLDSEVLSLCQPHLVELYKSWNSKTGIGFTRGHSVPDGDDTSLTFDVLKRFGYNPNISTLLEFEEERWFRCYPLETTSSISTNVHFMGALFQAGVDVNDPRIQKIIKYLEGTSTKQAFWYDKWHASPIYTTAHAIITCCGYCNHLIRKSVEWLIKQQNDDGSWGFFGPTAEETSYALQALSIWRRDGQEIVDTKILSRGIRWLEEHSEPPYPLLWIAKSLNYSEWIIKSEIISAKSLVAEVT